jgi:hypothetical protein
MNIQSKCNENENSITHLKSSVKEIKHTVIFFLSFLPACCYIQFILPTLCTYLLRAITIHI